MLEQLLKTIGVKSYLDLNPEERETYKVWENALSGRRLTDNDVKDFLENEKQETVLKLIPRNINERDDTFLKMKLEMIINLQKFLNSPIIEKEIAEKMLQAEIESKKS